MTLPLATPLKIAVQVSFSSDGAALIRPTFFFLSFIRILNPSYYNCVVDLSQAQNSQHHLQ